MLDDDLRTKLYSPNIFLAMLRQRFVNSIYRAPSRQNTEYTSYEIRNYECPKSTEDPILIQRTENSNVLILLSNSTIDLFIVNEDYCITASISFAHKISPSDCLPTEWTSSTNRHILATFQKFIGQTGQVTHQATARIETGSFRCFVFTQNAEANITKFRGRGAWAQSLWVRLFWFRA